MIFATIQTSIGYVILFLVFMLSVVFGLASMRKGKGAIGSEVATAPNRKPYYDDKTLETKRLDRVLTMAFLALAFISLALPLYWLREPGRQASAVAGQDRTFLKTGEELFGNNTPENHEGLGCAGCHGAEGVGGIASYTITDSGGRFIQQVTWKAPALNTASLRFNRSDLRYIIEYGRPFSPMAAWGVAGGGSLDAQSIEDLISYIQSIQISPAASQKAVAEGLEKEKAAAIAAGHPYKSDGEALFNLGYYADVASGTYSCGRCHTPGWSYGQKGIDGGGAYGPNLTNETAQFPGTVAGREQMLSFVCQGSFQGQVYGSQGMGTGRMPAFCATKDYNPATDLLASQPNVAKEEPGEPGSGMLTEAQVAKIVDYVRGL